MRTTKRKIQLVILALAMVNLQQSTRADEEKPQYGIRTDFGDVMIDNVGLGRSYNLRDLAGKPLKVTNRGQQTVTLLMDVQAPNIKDITPQRREMGFKPLPSPSWVTLSQSQFVVPPGESAYTDVVVTIPNDPSLYGKKFQIGIYSRTVDKGFLHVGVWSNLFLTVIPNPETQAAMEKTKKRGFIGTMDYTLLPDKLVILNAPIGRKIDIAKEIKRTIKLANSGSEAIELRAKVIPVGDSPIGLQEGFEEAKDLGWLKLSSDTFKVEPDSFVDPGLILEFPNDPKLLKKKIMFVIKVDPADSDIVGITYYG